VGVETPQRPSAIGGLRSAAVIDHANRLSELGDDAVSYLVIECGRASNVEGQFGSSIAPVGMLAPRATGW